MPLSSAYLIIFNFSATDSLVLKDAIEFFLEILLLFLFKYQYLEITISL